MRGDETDACQPVHAVEAREEGRKVGRDRLFPAVSQIEAVGVDVLTEQGDLADAVGDEVADLGLDGRRWTAALRASHEGDDAVRTAVRTPGHDLDPRLEGPCAPPEQISAHVRPVVDEGGPFCRGSPSPIRGCGLFLRRLLPGPPHSRRRQQLGQAVHVLRAEDAVDEREPLEERGALRLRKTAGDEDDACGSSRLSRDACARDGRRSARRRSRARCTCCRRGRRPSSACGTCSRPSASSRCACAPRRARSSDSRTSAGSTSSCGSPAAASRRRAPAYLA